jgi:8-oxo-dGTP pyrophosphatase MutT (NUDIX family)
VFDALHRELAAHAPADDKEARDVALISAFLREHPRDAHLRRQALGHLTGSGFVVDEERRHVLLLEHARLGRWLQPGGHGEGEVDPRAIALREIEEETGLGPSDLIPYPSEAILDVDVHPIPARPGEPAHPHLDIRYGFVARRGAAARISEESRALRWVLLDELPEDADAALRRAIGKLRPTNRPPGSSGGDG